MALFPGFERTTIDTARHNPTASRRPGPALLLMHGYPQTHVMWHKIAPRLAEDLPSWRPTSAATATAPSRRPPRSRALLERAMARDQVGVMRHLGFYHFSLVGHDRGGRVSTGSRSTIRTASPDWP